MSTDQTTPLTDEQLNQIEAHTTAATRCPEAEANGRKDGQHTWSGSSFTHTRCALCDYTRPRGERAEETALLVDEIRRLQQQRRFLIDQLAKKGAASGETERRLREFLSGEEQPASREDLAGPDGEQPDTLPAWLYQRFAVIHGAPAWDRLADSERSYWEHHARAVRRAVERGGFKAADEDAAPAV